MMAEKATATREQAEAEANRLQIQMWSEIRKHRVDNAQGQGGPGQAESTEHSTDK